MTRTKRSSRAWLLGGAVSVALISVWAVPAQAQEPTTAIDAVAPVAPDAIANASAAVEAIDGALVAADDEVTVRLSSDATEGVTMSLQGIDVLIGLPSSDKATGRLVAGKGMATYEGRYGNSTVAVVNDDLSTSLHTVIRNPTAPRSYSYEYSGDLHLLQYGDGGIGLLSTETDELIGVIAKPWAKDSLGHDVPTHYEVHGNTLTQFVGHNRAFAYPVVADPTTLGSNSMYSKIVQNSSSAGTIISVYPGQVKFPMYTNDQIFNSYKAIVPAAYEGQKYRDQLLCHVWNVGQLKAPWNLDSWRPNVGYAATVAALCNP